MYCTYARGMGTYLLSRAAWIVHYRWRAAKLVNFIRKFYHYLTMMKRDLLSKYLLTMELRFDAMLYSNLANENSDAGHMKCSRVPNFACGTEVPHPWYTIMKTFWAACEARVWHSWCRVVLQWWRDHRLEFLGLSYLAGNTFCVMATSAANDERVFSIDDHVVNSRRETLKSSPVNDILFSAVLWERSAEVWLVSTFLLLVFFKTFRWLWIESLNKLPPAVKRSPWVW